MIVKHAREAARRWVGEVGCKVPGFHGAYFAGSANWLPEDAELPAISDLDVVVVLAGPEPPHKPGKLVYQDVLLEVSYFSSERLRSPEVVLSDYHLAGGFRTRSVIADPSGALTRLQAAVSEGYPQCRWVRRRCAHARDTVLRHLRSFDKAKPLHDQVMSWVFGTGVTTHVLLVAGLKNPTVRSRYVAARALLTEYERLDFYEPVLDLLGCARLSPERVEQHLAAMTEAFDAAAPVIRSPVPFASDLSVGARPIAIDGSQELIVRGLHREAIFWIVVTYTRCRTVLAKDAPAETWERFEPGYRQLLGDLGIVSVADLQRRCDDVSAFLPRVWEVAEEIMAANAGIKE